MSSETTPMATEEENYLRARLAATEKVVKLLESRLAQSQARLETMHSELRTIVHSGGWKWARRYYVLKDRLMPPNSRRRNALGWLSRQLQFRSTPAEVPAPEPYARWQQLHEPKLFARYPQENVLPSEVGTVHIHWLDQAHTLNDQVDQAFSATNANPAACLYLQSTDQLHPRAIQILRQELKQHPEISFFTFDEDTINADGVRSEPLFKPIFSPDFILESDYIGRAVCFRGSTTEADPYAEVLKRAQAGEKSKHLPIVLMHTQQSLDGRMQDSGRQQTVERFVPGIQIEKSSGAVRYPLQQQPLISILIPSKDQPEVLERCVESILISSYPNREVIILDNNSQTISAKLSNEKLATRPGVRVIPWNHHFNFAAINNFGVRHANGEIFLFLNNDTQAINIDWLERMLEHVQRPEVGVVGAKLLYPDNKVQHAGVVIGMHDRSVGHTFKFTPDGEAGYLNRLLAIQNYQAVTGACLMMRKAVFEEVNGFDEQFFVDFNDIDLCLRVGQKGYRILMTPHARLYHFEGHTRGVPSTPAKRAMYDVERSLYLERWGGLIDAGDPYYSTNWSYSREDIHVQE